MLLFSTLIREIKEPKKGGNGVEDKYKSMFMNIPINIQDVCTGKDKNNDGNGDSPCDDCLEYDENILKKYKIKVK